MREWGVVGRFVLLAVALAGCSFDHGLVPSAGQLPPGDGGGEADTTLPACGWLYQPTGAAPCTGSVPTTEAVACTGTTVAYSTASDMMSGVSTTLDSSSDPPVRVVAVSRLEVCGGTTLKITGPYPLRVIVHGAVSIAGTIDVSAWQDGSQIWQPGPGGNACTIGTGVSGTASSAGSGGGGGGGYGAEGGRGGPGDGVSSVAGGLAEGTASLSPLRGGCAGGAGGAGTSASAGRSGSGAGALQISARDALVVSGTIEARGAPGGGGGGANAGGGGGGAGGAILLEATSITLAGSAALCANGGGGGGGANDGGPLNVGQEGEPGTCSNAAAAGGAGGNSNGQPGGAGGFAAIAAEAGNGADEGGGGGGGAVGRIRLRAVESPTVSGLVTPPAS